MKTKILKSLKSRYILFACLLSLLVIVVSFFGYRNVSLTSKEATANIETRRQLLEYVKDIRIDLFSAYKALDAFLLDPAREGVKQQAERSLQAAIRRSIKLNKLEWTIEQKLSPTVV